MPDRVLRISRFMENWTAHLQAFTLTPNEGRHIGDFIEFSVDLPFIAGTLHRLHIRLG